MKISSSSARNETAQRKRKPYDYTRKTVGAVWVDDIGDLMASPRLKPILRKLVREAVLERDRQLGVHGSPENRTEIARKLVP